MQLMAVLGSFTAGEIARSAISTIWMMPNSTSCCIVRVGPMSNARTSSAARARIDPVLARHPEQWHAGRHELADAALHP